MSNPYYPSEYQCQTPEGQRFEKFCGMLKHFRGDFAGKPFLLEPWQKKLFDELLGTKQADGRRQYDTTFIGLSRKNGKMVPLRSSVVTPTGTTTIGDLRVGDYVVGIDGRPAMVLAKSEIWKDSTVYEVEFSDGEVVECGGPHEWTVIAARNGDRRVVEAKWLAENQLRSTRGDFKYAVPSVIPDSSDAPLPVPPYILGAWLGDGDTVRPHFTGIEADLQPLFAELDAAGYDWYHCGIPNRREDYRRVRVIGHCGTWRSAGFALKQGVKDKRIPEAYLHASKAQRIALLQGLMDTDGSSSATGACTFTQKKGALLDDVRRLLASLGIYAKPTFQTPARGGVTGRLTFYPPEGVIPFRIPRKADRVRPRKKPSCRKIVRVTKTDRTEDQQCIQVVGGHFLVGNYVTTHNSTIAAALGLYMLLLDGEEGAEVAVAAGDRAQAGILFDMAKRFVESCPSVARHCKLYRNSIAVPKTGSRFITVSSDAGTAHGLNLSLAVIDEAHVHKSRELADTLVSSMGSRRQPLAAYITTAGFSLGGWAHREFEKAKKIQDGILESPHYYPFIACADPEDDPFSMESAYKANPNLGVSIKEDYIEKWIEKARLSTSDEVTYRTLHLSQWLSSENRWLKAQDWINVMTPLREDRDGPAFIGVDLSSVEDTTAVSIIWPREDGTIDVECQCYIPSERAARKEETDRVPYRDWAKRGWVRLTDGDVVDYEVVTADIMALCEKYDVRQIAVDRWNAQSVIAALQYEGLPVVAYSQGIGSMSPPTKLLHTKILRREVRGGDNEALQWQMTNAAVKQDINENIKIAKPNSDSPERVDMAVATVMAFGVGGSHIVDQAEMRIEFL